jgi:type VI secretion system secreted protein VgrG
MADLISEAANLLARRDERVELTIAGALHEVVELRGEEGVSKLFRFEVRCAAQAQDPSPDSLLAREATITLRDGYLANRKITGIVAEAELEVFDDQKAELVVVIRPKCFPITLGRDCYVLQDVDVVDVAKDVLDGSPMPVRYEIAGSYHKRVYCAQYREDDWTFLCRLLEEEGIYYWFDHEGDETTLVFCDHSTSAPPIAGGAFIAFAYETGRQSAVELVEQIGSVTQATTTRFSVGSFDPMHPRFKVQATEGEGPLEHYDAPGGGSEKPQVIAARARTMREAAAAARVSVAGITSSARFVPGMHFALGGHPMARLDGEYFLTSTSYVMQQRRRNADSAERSYVCQFTAIPFSTTFRPPKDTPPGKQAGLQMGVVVGSPGEEIHPDAHGRVRVQQHWDRLGKKDHTAGKWLRIAQRSTPGSMLLPRVGWNVASFNEEGSVDAPSLLNRVHDAEHPPAYPLPANKTRTVWKTATSPGGGSFNEMYFEDSRGAEEMFFNASKDMNVLVQNIKNEFITNDSTRKVGGDHKLTVEEDSLELVVNDQTVTIGGDETLEIEGGRAKSVESDETVTIGGDRTLEVKEAVDLTVEGDRTLNVDGSQTDKTEGNISATMKDSEIVIGGTAHKTCEGSMLEDVGTKAEQTIKGDKIEVVKKNRTLEVQKAFTEEIGGKMSLSTEAKFLDNAQTTSKWKVGGELAGKAPDVWVEAVKEIRIICGSSTITITTSSIAIKAAALDLSGATIHASTAKIDHN